ARPHSRQVSCFMNVTVLPFALSPGDTPVPGLLDALSSASSGSSALRLLIGQALAPGASPGWAGTGCRGVNGPVPRPLWMSAFLRSQGWQVAEATVKAPEGLLRCQTPARARRR